MKAVINVMLIFILSLLSLRVTDSVAEDNYGPESVGAIILIETQRFPEKYQGALAVVIANWRGMETCLLISLPRLKNPKEVLSSIFGTNPHFCLRIVIHSVIPGALSNDDSSGWSNNQQVMVAVSPNQRLTCGCTRTARYPRGLWAAVFWALFLIFNTFLNLSSAFSCRCYT